MTALNLRTEGAVMAMSVALRVGAKLGEGRLGDVHEVLEYPDAPLGIRLVLKRIHPWLLQDDSFRNRLRVLFERLPQLHHPYAEQVLEACLVDQSTAYMICERLDGETLAARLRRDGRLSLQVVRQFARQVAEALTLAHSLGLAHGNLTPRSIIVMQAGREDTASPLRIKVRGFGCAPPLVGGVYGTPSYLAPEQVDTRDPRPQATPLSDQHALACIIHEALVGRLLFPGDSVDAVRPRLVRHDAPHFVLRGIDPLEVQRVDQALQMGLAKDPASRFENLRLFIDAVEGQRQPSRVRAWPAPAGLPVAQTGGAISDSGNRSLPGLVLGSVMRPAAVEPADEDSEGVTLPLLRRSDLLLESTAVPGPSASRPKPDARQSVSRAIPNRLRSLRRPRGVVPLVALFALSMIAWFGFASWGRSRLAESDTVDMGVQILPVTQPSGAPVEPGSPFGPGVGVTAGESGGPRGGDRVLPSYPGGSGGHKSPKPPLPRRTCRADRPASEYLGVGRLAQCLERTVPPKYLPMKFEFQLNRRYQLVPTATDEPAADASAQRCAAALASDVRHFPDDVFTIRCRP